LEGRSIGSKALFLSKNLIAKNESCPFIPKINFDAFALIFGTLELLNLEL